MLQELEFKKIFRFFAIVSAIFLTLGLLASCGSSGGGSSGAPAGTDTRSFGEIESLGSIVVNGVKFEVEDGLIVGPDNLTPKPGMIVEVEGRLNDDGLTGTALEVKFDDNVKGPLTALVPIDDSTLVGTVMGQEVIFEDNITKFDPVSGLPLGDDINKVFMVSGLVRDDGMIHATFVSKLSNDDFANFLLNGGILEVTGVISNLTATTFQINDLIVVYSGAVLRDLPAGGLANGLLVEVKGNAFNSITGTLTATDIEGKQPGLGGDIAKVEAEGFIAGLNTGNMTFSLNGQLVDYLNATFRNGEEVDLADGIKVEVEGPLSNGTLLATRVTFKSSVRIEATVATIVGNALTFAGLEGVSVRIHDLFTDGAEALGTIQVGNEVKIRARQAASGLIATRLERIGDGPGDSTLIRGPVTGITNPIVTILETVNVSTSTISDNNFEDVNDNLITRQQFFAALNVGDIVKARFRAGVWDQIEFEED